jgi:hypothetical protein
MTTPVKCWLIRAPRGGKLGNELLASRPDATDGASVAVGSGKVSLQYVRTVVHELGTQAQEPERTAPCPAPGGRCGGDRRKGHPQVQSIGCDKEGHPSSRSTLHWL